MREYPIIAVFWTDHVSFQREEIPAKIDLSPTLTVGILIKKTKKHHIIAYNIERYETYDEADFIILLSNAIVGIKEFGSIEIRKIRSKGAS